MTLNLDRRSIVPSFVVVGAVVAVELKHTPADRQNCALTYKSRVSMGEPTGHIRPTKPYDKAPVMLIKKLISKK